jgi:hypothetical protein
MSVWCTAMRGRCTLSAMANRWVSLRLVCSCVALLSVAVTARGQEATEATPVEPPPSPSEAQTAALSGEGTSASTESTAAPTTAAATPGPTENSSNTGSDVQTASAPPAPAQTGGFTQRLTGSGFARQPVPAANRDSRLDLLETSFPAEQPEIFEPAPPPDSLANSRRTLARTANGITEISNRPELPNQDRLAVFNRATSPKPPSGRPSVKTEVDNPRLESQVGLPSNAVARSQSSMSPWLWVLAATAALLLVPIAFLLTRPTR